MATQVFLDVTLRGVDHVSGFSRDGSSWRRLPVEKSTQDFDTMLNMLALQSQHTLGALKSHEDREYKVVGCPNKGVLVRRQVTPT